jgi:hypothetical protein
MLTKRTRIRTGPTAVAAVLLLTLWCGGCARICYDVRHACREVNDYFGHDPWCYYHSPETGEIVTKHKHHCCPGMAEPPFYGFHGTCWRKWPEGWINCPIIEEEIVTIEPVGESVVVPPQPHPPQSDSIAPPAPPVAAPPGAIFPPQRDQGAGNDSRPPDHPVAQEVADPSPSPSVWLAPAATFDEPVRRIVVVPTPTSDAERTSAPAKQDDAPRDQHDAGRARVLQMIQEARASTQPTSAPATNGPSEADVAEQALPESPETTSDPPIAANAQQTVESAATQTPAPTAQVMRMLQPPKSARPVPSLIAQMLESRPEVETPPAQEVSEVRLAQAAVQPTHATRPTHGPVVKYVAP